METAVPATTAVPLDRIGALRAESEAVLGFCAELSPQEWDAPSLAAGWRVRDVIAHLAAGCRLMFSPSVLGLVTTRQVERFNDKLVARRQGMTPAQLVAEYRTWAPRAVRLFSLMGQPPLASIALPVGELGRYPVRIVPSALTFDAHTHLRHDIAGALERPVPATDARRMAVALEWLLALLEQLGAEHRTWLEQPLQLTLTGDGGGSWSLRPAGRGRLRVGPGGGSTPEASAEIRGAAADFPIWSTRRKPWRDCELVLVGDRRYATRFLDTVHLV